MLQLITLQTETLRLKNSVNLSPFWRGFRLIPLLLACFAFSTAARAVVPAPDGGYPGSNTAEGENALFSLTSGTFNTAIGNNALFTNSTGSQNTATGAGALELNTTGSNNTADGFVALFSNTTGSNNTASGDAALLHNTTGNDNTAIGFTALESNTTGFRNTATGSSALLFNTTGDSNTASGFEALLVNATGDNNTATGFEALHSITTGSENTATGFQALLHNTTGANNIALGFEAGFNLTTGSNNIDIGNEGVPGESNTVRIGRQPSRIAPQGQTATFIAGIIGAAVAGPVVHVSSSGQLGVPPSSARFKDEIKPMDKASEAILALKPVTFRYKQEIDQEGIPQFGLVAEEVEKVNPALVARDAEGKVYTVRYKAVNAMLLNEFLKEHRAVQEQKATIAQLKSTVAKQEATAAHQQKQIAALTATVQKVSAQVEMSRPVPQTVVDNH